ncbi:MAG: thymidine phosphorylase [Bacilli bacterium]|nr:thymidine phosphorylase [Bacilli bacterium]
MNMIDIIDKKRKGLELLPNELNYAFNGYLKNIIPDYQMSSLLMAICIKGMTDKEIFELTDLFIKSGDKLDLDNIKGVKVDKHSTGGVGDKTTLVIGSIVASLGVKVPKMSGRGLGHTGGTIDKLESIPGFKTALSREEFINQVNEIGFAVTSQTGNLAPLDKKVYALRDVTGTVESIPLIAASIMSKKIASGADKIIVDVKVGNGALLKTREEAIKLSEIMKKIGGRYGREVETMVTYMDIPLGTTIGNSLEILEVMKILKGEENNYLVALCMALASKMIVMGKGISIEEATKEVQESITSRKAYTKFLEFVKAQGGQIEKLEVSTITKDVISNKKGHVVDMDAYKFGKLSLDLGGGRIVKDQQIDPKVGIVLKKKIGDDVFPGDVLCTLYISEKSKFDLNEIIDYYTFK